MSGHPEDLLRGALEKIVFFECRLSQLEAELAAAREVAARDKEAAAAGRGRETALEAELVQARAALDGERARAGELEDRNRLLQGEREHFLKGLIDQARIAAAPGPGVEPDGERADLAGFIAELRGEVERLRPWKAAAEKAGIRPEEEAPARRAPRAAEPVRELAAHFQAAGRLGLAPAEAKRLQAQLPTRAERSLYEKSMDDLASADPGARRRAADCLGALGSAAAAPLVAAAVGREEDAGVKVSLLGALAALAEPAAADIARRALEDRRPAVRAAALDALAALAKERAEPDLLRALADPSPIVRRRAVLLVGFVPGTAAEDALVAALGDRDSGVGRAAALALSGRPTARAQGALARALDHREPSVRRAAAASVSRWAGEPVDAEAGGAERRRAARRIADKLAAVAEGALRDAIVSAADVPAAAVADLPTAAGAAPRWATAAASIAAPVTARAPVTSAAPIAPAAPVAAPAPIATAAPITTRAPIATASSSLGDAPASLADASAAAPQARVAVAVLEGPGPPHPLEETVFAEVRASLRGCSLDDLAAVVPGGRPAAEVALRALLGRGALVQRGARFFTS